MQNAMIPFELLTALMGFALVSSITPGPNNLMLMASGANFGFMRSIPHMLGIGVGFTVMIVLVGLGLIGLFDAFPVSYIILKVCSVAYLLWLAWKIANAAPPQKGEASGDPMTFIQAALFQWVNPKAWSMALTAITAYAPGQTVQAILIVAAVFGAINLPSVSVWTLMGQQIRRLLNKPVWLRAFNICMAILLVASAAPVLLMK
jgi:threonine/homoserine/homoserine lactone efflux protein